MVVMVYGKDLGGQEEEPQLILWSDKISDLMRREGKSVSEGTLRSFGEGKSEGEEGVFQTCKILLMQLHKRNSNRRHPSCLEYLEGLTVI